MTKNDFYSLMTKYNECCDLLDGCNYEGIKYYNCSECYRYEICAEAFKQELITIFNEV